MGRFNCYRSNCSVAKCPRKKNAKRIVDNLTRWRRLRKVEREAKVNLSVVNQVWSCPAEALVVLSAATNLNQNGEDMNHNQTVAESEEFHAVIDELHTSAVAHGAEEDLENDSALPWLGQS